MSELKAAKPSEFICSSCGKSPLIEAAAWNLPGNKIGVPESGQLCPECNKVFGAQLFDNGLR